MNKNKRKEVRKSNMADCKKTRLLRSIPFLLYFEFYGIIVIYKEEGAIGGFSSCLNKATLDGYCIHQPNRSK